MEDLFEKFEIDFLTFDKVENKRSLRPDLHAFLLLDALVPGTDDMVAYACHDEIYLAIEPEDLANVATEDGNCSWSGCPQLRDGEPIRSGRHCPLDTLGEAP